MQKDYIKLCDLDGITPLFIQSSIKLTKFLKEKNIYFPVFLNNTLLFKIFSSIKRSSLFLANFYA